MAQYANSGEKILDLGCGSGRLLEILKIRDINYIGLDSSQDLIEVAQKNYPKEKFIVGDGLNLPFPQDFFDKIFSIRTVHHVPSKEFRFQFFQEAKRVLKPGGLFILTAWYLYKLRSKKNFLLMVKNIFLKTIGESKLDFGDALIPWGNKAMRYYHYFTKRELQKLALESGFIVKKIWTTRFDIYLIAQKPL